MFKTTFQYRLVFLFFAPIFVFAQEEDAGKVYRNHVYLDHIKSVKWHLQQIPLSNPIVTLNSRSKLELSFDDLSDEAKTYTYTIEHCDKNWNPSDLTEFDFIQGFTDEEIENYEFSFNTITNYTHYTLTLPNDDFRWTISGNYLLKIYLDEDEKQLAITRRFMVVDPQMRISVDFTPPAMVSNTKTHHEIDFEINHKGVQINNPQTDINVVILKNGNWHNPITGLKPLFIRENKLVYDYQNKIVFPAGKEFRFLDLRSLRFMPDKVSDISRTDDGYEITLFKEQSRAYSSYLHNEDLNGNFLIENLDENNPHLRSEYAYVIFALAMNLPLEDADIYVYGGLTDWELKEEFKMVYNTLISGYVARPFLKQGYYDYLYAVVPKGSKKIDLEELEGNWYETENEYTILVYFKPFGKRYDQLVAYYNFSNRDQ